MCSPLLLGRLVDPEPSKISSSEKMEEPSHVDGLVTDKRVLDKAALAASRGKVAASTSQFNFNSPQHHNWKSALTIYYVLR